MSRKDFYYNKAKVEGYRSRASYKLKQINEFHSVIKRNDSVVDIGAAPGGWLQVAIELSKTGIVIGVDMQKIEPLEGAITIRGDITNGATKEKIKSILEDKRKRKGNKKLNYIDFGCKGYQVRDCLHPLDLGNLIKKQIKFDMKIEIYKLKSTIY